MKLSKLKAQLDRFKRDEDGAITAYIVATFLLMVLGTGMAIDLMRHEVARADVQNALDRAVLAAAALDQKEDREEVIRTYMNTRNFHELDDPELIITSSEASAKRALISAKARYNVPTWFMKMIGITELAAPAASSALQGLSEIEIVLVFDHSGSMEGEPADPDWSIEDGGQTRMEAAQDAAKAFIDEVLKDGADEYTSIAIVPFQTTTPIQTLMKDQYLDGYRCHHFEEDDYLIPNVPTDVNLNPETRRDEDNCSTSFGRYLIPFTNDQDMLEDYIDDMWGEGHTSQNIGMKWALAILDPSFRDVMQAMVADMKENEGEPDENGEWDIRQGEYIYGMPVTESEGGQTILDISRANQTPRDYGDQDVQKIIVLMTDGHNRHHWDDGNGHNYMHDEDLSSEDLNNHARNVCDQIHQRAGDNDIDITVYTIAFNLREDETLQWEGWFGDPNDDYVEYDQALLLLGDDPDMGCASEGLALSADSPAALEAEFGKIAAEISRLKLVN